MHFVSKLSSYCAKCILCPLVNFFACYLQLGTIRNFRRKKVTWRRLYSFCDSHHYEGQVGHRGLTMWSALHRQRRAYNVPRMYKAIQHWKYTQGKRLLSLWRARISENIFRIRSMQALQHAYESRRMLSFLQRLRDFSKFR